MASDDSEYDALRAEHAALQAEHRALQQKPPSLAEHEAHNARLREHIEHLHAFRKARGMSLPLIPQPKR